MKKLEITILMLIILLGGFLRLYGLDKSPPSLNWDEAAFGYNAYSILHTGRDEYGKLLPLFTRSFDEYKPAIPIYLMIPLIAILGLNEVSVRMVSALSGIFSALVIFLIARKIFRSSIPGYFSAFFFAISPYSVYFSRVMFEVNLALLFFLLGFLLFLYKDKKFALSLSLFFFILSMYTYNSFRLLTPLFALGLFLLSRNELSKKRILIKNILFGFALLLPMVQSVLNGTAVARFQYTSILKFWPPPLWETLVQNHNLSGLFSFIIHNQFFYFFWELAARYIGYFSPANLFLRESAEPTLLIPSLAILNPFEFIFLSLGLFYILRNYPLYKQLVLLMLLAPIPAVITWNLFQSIRVLPLFVVFSFISGYGAYLILRALRSFSSEKNLQTFLVAIFLVGTITVGLWSAFYLFDSLMVILPMSYFGNWQPGFKQSMPIISHLQDQYDQIIIDSPHSNAYIFTLFYLKYPPEKYLNELNYEKISISPRNYYDFGKFKFRKIYWPDDRGGHKKLFMGTVYSLPEQDIKNTPNAKIIEDIKDPSGAVSVRIVSLD